MTEIVIYVLSAVFYGFLVGVYWAEFYFTEQAGAYEALAVGLLWPLWALCWLFSALLARLFYR
jgi:hypothetical protein